MFVTLLSQCTYILMNTKQINIMNGYQIYLMIELAKCHGLISDEQEYDTTWAEGQQLYEKFQASEFDVDTASEYDCIEKFLIKELEGASYDMENRSSVDELDLNIQALAASYKGKAILANTIWSLIELKGYKRLDSNMSLGQLKSLIKN